ncbi:hypothetical protein [Pontibacter amylolyticus]|uniref:Uncharacterized protein n=1 Tax=Pontibacter amylolyticus TaxID=1424080 RepID=A0ABQ1WCQ3_9BACT|nr:hypothetical protein [Pontibacter amylolyticus]GGG24375.1 hypothetical protein GCM10011323_30220 [Pontibacter amylolyticus]
MAVKTKINFERLLVGTELETPEGIGRFRLYKEGNFKDQNVLVEHPKGRMKWYAAHELQLHASNNRAEQEGTRIRPFTARAPELLYYAI